MSLKSDLTLLPLSSQPPGFNKVLFLGLARGGIVEKGGEVSLFVALRILRGDESGRRLDYTFEWETMQRCHRDASL